MRIVHVITRMIIGGAQENTLYTVAGLLEKGYDVLLVSGPSRGREGSLEPVIAGRRIPFRAIRELVRDFHPVLDPIAFLKLGLLFRRERFDVIHTHSAKAGFLGRLAARVFSPSSMVVHTVHGLSFHAYQNPLVRSIYVLAEKVALGCTDGFIAVGEVMVEKSLKAGLGPRSRYTVVYSGFDVRQYEGAAGRRLSMRQALGVRDDEILIGMIGRLFPLKGQEYLLRAFVRIAADLPSAKLLFVGDGILRAGFQKFAETHNLAGRILFPGLVPPDKIPDYASAMDIGAHTSLREGLPRAVVQIMAAGKPVVAFDIDGAREVVRDGETGFLVPPGNETVLENRLRFLLAHPADAATMGARARAAVTAAFSIETMVAEIEKVYFNILQGRTPASGNHQQG